MALDREGCVFMINQKGCDILNYKEKDILGKNWFDSFLAADVREEVRTVFTEMMSGDVEQEEYHINPVVSRDGITKMVAFHNTLLYNDKGKIIGTLSSGEDISERVRAEKALRESEERYRAVVENSHDGIFIVGGDYRFKYVNETFCHIIKREKEEIIGHDFSEFLDEENNALVAAQYNDQKERTGIPTHIELDIIRKGGEKRRVNISYTFVRDSRDQFYMIAQLLDVTEKTRAENALKESEIKYRNLFQSAADAIFIMDKEIFVDCNKATVKMFGCVSTDDIIGHTPWEFSPPYQPDGQLSREKAKQLIRLALTGVQQKFYWQHSRKDGSTFHTEVSLNRLNLQDKFYIQAMVRDETERIEAEKQIKNNLREKEVLLKEIHHRVKNNLNVITSLLNLQSKNLRSKEQSIAAFKESRDRIYAMAMVHEMLYNSSNYSDINIRNYIQNLISKLRQIYSVSINITYDLHIGDIILDINKAVPCGLIMNEIITNALKHAFKGKENGEISIVFHKLKNNSFELRVSDNGIGIPKDLNPEKSLTLGLKLIFILTKQLEGSLRINRGKGTEFIVEFPVRPK